MQNNPQGQRGGSIMTKDIKDNMVRVVILDISSVYAQIYDQGYFDSSSVDKIKQQYSDAERWRVIVLD